MRWVTDRYEDLESHLTEMDANSKIDFHLVKLYSGAFLFFCAYGFPEPGERV